MMNLKKVFKTWYNPLSKHLNKQSNYYNKLFEFLNLSYKVKLIYPEKKNVFKTLQLTDYNNLKVVIVGEDSYPNNKATGIAFANEDNIRESSFSPSLLKIKDCIEQNVYNGLYLNFDPTLENWCEQGVLLLNTSLTAEANNANSHTKYWNRFITNLLTTVNENKTGIIFCFWGNQAKQFKDLINTNHHYILEYINPSEAVIQNIDWKCTHFNDINTIITKNNGKSECIEW